MVDRDGPSGVPAHTHRDGDAVAPPVKLSSHVPAVVPPSPVVARTSLLSGPAVP